MYRPTRKQELQKIFLESRTQRPPRRQEGPALGAAAVGFCLREDSQGELSFLLTLRSDKLEHHAGEVCLPGGHLDIDDEGDFIKALDREFQEEVGLPAGSVEWIGDFDELQSKSGTRVRPYVGFLKSAAEPQLNLNFEVVRAEWCPLAGIYRDDLWTFKELPRHFPSRPLMKLPFWSGFEPEVWGLTAGFMWLLRERLS